MRRRATVHFVLAGLCAGLLAVNATPARAGKPAAAKNILDRTRSVMLGSKLVVKPGDWVSYTMEVKPPEGFGVPSFETKVKISLPLHVDAERPLKKGQYWMEFEFSDVLGKKDDDMFIALKALFEGDPRDKKSIRRMYMAMGNRLPIEIPAKYYKEGDGGGEHAACWKGDQKKCAAGGGKIRRFPPKKVYTKQGWIRGKRILVTLPQGGGAGEVWTSDKIPVFGLIRASMSGPSNMKLELDSFGKGALSRIDETKAVPMPDPEELEKQLKSLNITEKKANIR